MLEDKNKVLCFLAEVKERLGHWIQDSECPDEISNLFEVDVSLTKL